MSRLYRQDQDQDFFFETQAQDQDFYFKTKTKTIFHVLEAPRDQDQGLETTSLARIQKARGKLIIFGDIHKLPL